MTNEYKLPLLPWKRISYPKSNVSNNSNFSAFQIFSCSFDYLLQKHRHTNPIYFRHYLETKSENFVAMETLITICMFRFRYFHKFPLDVAIQPYIPKRFAFPSHREMNAVKITIQVGLFLTITVVLIKSTFFSFYWEIIFNNIYLIEFNRCGFNS